jgi:hypothetical protein
LGLTAPRYATKALRDSPLGVENLDPAVLSSYQPRSHRLEADILYHVADFDYDFGESTGMPPALSQSDATSLAVKSHLLSIMASKLAPELLEIGQCLATAVPSKVSSSDNVCLWLVIRLTVEFCYCVRIRTYQGNGIKHLAADREIQARNVDPTTREQQLRGVDADINAHAIVYPRGARSAHWDPNEPRMTKESLAIALNYDIEPGVIDQMARACFTRICPVDYGQKYVSVGQVHAKYRPFFDAYVDELYGETTAALESV